MGDSTDCTADLSLRVSHRTAYFTVDSLPVPSLSLSHHPLSLSPGNFSCLSLLLRLLGFIRVQLKNISKFLCSLL